MFCTVQYYNNEIIMSPRLILTLKQIEWVLNNFLALFLSFSLFDGCIAGLEFINSYCINLLHRMVSKGYVSFFQHYLDKLEYSYFSD